MSSDTNFGFVYGALAGFAASTVAIVWGGYELGSFVNDQLNLQNTIARGSIDLAVMALLFKPVYWLGLNKGADLGEYLGFKVEALSNKIYHLKERYHKDEEMR